MRILITNDDGYNAIGIKLLAERAKKYGEVFIIAPKTEKSATSHAIDVRNYFEYKKIDEHTYYVDSTPADCVRFAQYGLKLDFDIIFSGCNKGFNVGEDIWYSGTLGAIFEAKSLNKKAIGFSSDSEGFEGFISHFDEVMEYINNNHLLDICDLYNVNFPREPKGIKITKQGGNNFITFFVEDNGKVLESGYKNFASDPNRLDVDSCCVMNNFISIMPLTSDRTDNDAYKKLTNKIN